MGRGVLLAAVLVCGQAFASIEEGGDASSSVRSIVEKSAVGLTARQKKEVAEAILKHAERNKLDPLLVVALIRTESSFNNYAVSEVGALGLMQVMPDTGKWLAEKSGIPFGNKKELFDPQLNIELGTAYLADLIKRFGSVERALVAYNAGPGNAQKILKNDARRDEFLAGYPKKVVSDYRKLRAKLVAAKPAQSAPAAATGGR